MVTGCTRVTCISTCIHSCTHLRYLKKKGQYLGQPISIEINVSNLPRGALCSSNKIPFGERFLRLLLYGDHQLISWDIREVPPCIILKLYVSRKWLCKNSANSTVTFIWLDGWGLAYTQSAVDDEASMHTFFRVCVSGSNAHHHWSCKCILLSSSKSIHGGAKTSMSELTSHGCNIVIVICWSQNVSISLWKLAE